MNEKIAIVILGGGLIKAGNNWRTTRYDEGDAFGATGDYVRVVAGYYLHQKYPDAQIIVSGGKGQFSAISDAPTIASVLKKELLQMGAIDGIIIEENKSGSTKEQLINLNVLQTKTQFDRILLVSNQWHLPRVKTFFEIMPQLQSLLPKIEFIAAEKVALEYEPKKWQAVIDSAYQSEEIKKRIELEHQGIKALRDGNYT